jgi:hypothetical protein
LIFVSVLMLNVASSAGSYGFQSGLQVEVGGLLEAVGRVQQARLVK